MTTLKYHAVLDFGYQQPPVKFTAASLKLLVKRFNTEIEKEVERRKEAREYTWIEPNLTVEVK